MMDTPARWSLTSRLLHWIMAALILFQLGMGLAMTEFVADVTRQFALTQTHKSLGFVAFVLVLARIGWRLANRRRPALPPMPAWQVKAAAASHVALYGLMLAMPLSGWILASASPLQDLLGMQNMVFGLFPLPDPFVPGNEAVERIAGRVHAGLAIALAMLVALHVAAALKHQFADRDGLLTRMIAG